MPVPGTAVPAVNSVLTMMTDYADVDRCCKTIHSYPEKVRVLFLVKMPAHLCQSAGLRSQVRIALLLDEPGPPNRLPTQDMRSTRALARVLLCRGWFAVDFLSTFPFAFVVLACLDGGGYDTATYRYWALLQLLAMARLPLLLLGCDCLGQADSAFDVTWPVVQRSTQQVSLCRCACTASAGCLSSWKST